jgi:hypothetical protein
MPDLNFAVESAGPVRGAAPPLLAFRLRVTEPAADPAPILSIALRCQVRIQPARRRYSTAEQKSLLDLFGTPDRWGQTVRDLQWATASVTVPPFVGATAVRLPVSCDRDPTRAASRYLDALGDGDAALIFLFSGTVFYEAPGVGPQVAMIPWDREARFRLPVAVWKSLFATVASLTEHGPGSQAPTTEEAVTS